MPAPAVIPAPTVYSNIVVVKTLVFYLLITRPVSAWLHLYHRKLIMSSLSGTLAPALVRSRAFGPYP